MSSSDDMERDVSCCRGAVTAGAKPVHVGAVNAAVAMIAKKDFIFANLFKLWSVIVRR